MSKYLVTMKATTEVDAIDEADAVKQWYKKLEHITFHPYKIERCNVYRNVLDEKKGCEVPVKVSDDEIRNCITKALEKDFVR